jgi:hypothetical protein
MTNYPMQNEEKAARLIELVKKAYAGLPPQPHDVRTPEHLAQCDECRQRQRAQEASFEEIEKQEGMMSGEVGILMFMALASKANTLAGSPRPFSLTALEKLSGGAPGGLVKELAQGLEWAANTKAAMLPVSNVLEKAINDGELEIPEHRQTHKSHEEFLVCDICQDWEKRRDAILEKALGPRKPDWG